MKFNDWSKKRILEGKKSLTSRIKRYDNDPDVSYIFGPLPLWFIVMYLYEGEGAKNPQELKKVFNQIFRRDVEWDKEFYVHLLKTNAIIERLKEGL